MSSLAPIASVVIPAYNHERFVAEAIRSVQRQTFLQWELVVLDDGSKDDTYAAAVAAAAHDPRIRVSTRPNRGSSRTLNEAISMTTGRVIIFLASDDRMVLNRIETQLAEFADPTVGLAHSDAVRIDVDGRVIDRMKGFYRPAIGFPARELLLGTVGIVAPTLATTRDAYERVGGFDESAPIEDWPFYTRIALAGFRFAYNEEPLTDWRVTPGNSGGRTSIHWRSTVALLRGMAEGLGSEFAEEVGTRALKREYIAALHQRRPAVALEILGAWLQQHGASTELAGWTLAAMGRNVARDLLPQVVHSAVRRRILGRR